jgi:hypothetical protein
MMIRSCKQSCREFFISMPGGVGLQQTRLKRKSVKSRKRFSDSSLFQSEERPEA